MAILTGDSFVVGMALLAKLEEMKVNNDVAEVYYGPERLIPTFPSITLELGDEVRDIVGTNQYRVDFVFFFNVFYGVVGSGEANQQGAEALIQVAKAKLHEDKKLGGLVVFGFVTRLQPVVLRATEGPVLRSIRGTWEAQSREDF